MVDNQSVNLLCLSLSNEIKNGNINNSSKLVEDIVKLKPIVKILPNNMISLDEKWNLEKCELSKINIHDSNKEIEIGYYINNYLTIGELKLKVKLQNL